MPTHGRNTLKSKTEARCRSLVVATMLAGMFLLQACGGNSGSSPAVPSTTNPAPGETLVSITVGPAIPILPIGSTRQMIATGVYNDGSTQNITSEVTWASSSPQNGSGTASNLPVNYTGLVSAKSLGASVITATLGPIVGAYQLQSAANSYQSNTIAILPVPSGAKQVDAAYVSNSTAKIQGAYAVQEVNLDADQSSSFLPVPSSLIASIPMPAGFVPNATVGSPESNLVAVISYNSPDVQIIDASNLSSDVASNTVISTFKSPVTQSATFYGPSTQVPAFTCMICAGVVDPSTNLLLLSTAQGFYSMNFSTGTFTALPFTPAPLPAPSFTLNPLASPPYILSAVPNVLSPAPSPAAVQFINLSTDAVTEPTYLGLTALGLTAPNEVSLDVSDDFVAIGDAAASAQPGVSAEALVYLPSSQVISYQVTSCSGSTPYDMSAIGVGANLNPANVPHSLFVTETDGNCVGVEQWATSQANAGTTPFPQADAITNYQYVPIPPIPSPDDTPFVNGNDPNTIATFTSVVDQKNYGVLVDASQNWIAKINLPGLANVDNATYFYPAGALIVNPLNQLTGVAGAPIVFLPTPASVVTLSQVNINFLNQQVGTSSAQSLVTLANVGPNFLNISGIAIQGADAADFSQVNNCGNQLTAYSKCSIFITFTPTAVTPPNAQDSAIVSITDDGGASPQIITLSGVGT